MVHQKKWDHSFCIKLLHLQLQPNLLLRPSPFTTAHHSSWSDTCWPISPNWWQMENISKTSLMTNFTARLHRSCICWPPVRLENLSIYPGSSWKDGWGEDGLCYNTHWGVLFVSLLAFGPVLFMIAYVLNFLFLLNYLKCVKIGMLQNMVINNWSSLTSKKHNKCTRFQRIVSLSSFLCQIWTAFYSSHI